MSDFKTSLLVNRQVPEFVREEYPLFISFLEAYYEFLETKQGSELNDLTSKAKDLRNLSDVDASIADFETNFFNTFANLVPREVTVDKAFLIKQILPFYLAKGSDKSFQLLFRLLYNEEVEILKPKNNILRASDGKWLIENAFRIEQLVYSLHTGNGTTKVFNLPQEVYLNEITVTINGVLQTSGYNVRRESKRLVFNTAPANNAAIEVAYNSFEFGLLTNRQIVGDVSGATALVERTAQKTVNSVPVYEMYINTKTLNGTFANGETATVFLVDSTDGSLIKIRVHGLSILRTINIIDGGASYNVGDTVIISGGEATTNAKAVVSEVFSGFINQVRILAGGAGFKTGSNVYVIGSGAASLSLAIDGVDTTGINSANSFVVNTDRIADYGSVLINAANYGFNASVVTENVTSKIVDALVFETVTNIGPITNVAILFANATFATVPTLDADSAPYLANGTIEYVLSSHSLGRINIISGGTNYQIGDEIIFAETQPMAIGIGAAAAVTNVSSTGAITKVELQPSRVRGTANTFGNSNVTVVGTGTIFQDDLRVGDYIMINNESRYINSISSNTSLNVNVNFNYATTNKPVGKYGDYPIGGQNYNQSHPPILTVNSQNGANANLSMVALMGDGENLFATADQDPGAILKIRIVDAGSGYEFPPQIDLTQSGDGLALANATVEPSYTTFAGRWTTSDSILSSSERVIQGRNYFVDYSYVLSSAVEFSKFKDVFKALIHPAGFIDYAQFNIIETIDANTLTTAAISVSNTIAGTVNVTSGSVLVDGLGTKFGNVSSVTITAGTQIAVNSEIRTISSVISNTRIQVSSSFTYSSNDQTLVVL